MLKIDFSRSYVCDCGYSMANVDPNAVDGHWLSPKCPKCHGNMTILPVAVTSYNKRKGSLGKGRRFDNPDGAVAKALKSAKIGFQK